MLSCAATDVYLRCFALKPRGEDVPRNVGGGDVEANLR